MPILLSQAVIQFIKILVVRCRGAGFAFDVNDDALCTNKGWFSECSVHSILFDIEGVIGFAPMYDVLINEQKNTTALTSIFSFIAPLKVNNSGSSAAIDTEVSDQTIDVITDIYGDSETNNGTGTSTMLPIYEQF